MDYETIRTSVGTCGLVYFVLLFVGVVFFTFRPGSTKRYQDAAEQSLKRD
jgi:cytochrome c oxidase cbb3-type subunit 4